MDKTVTGLLGAMAALAAAGPTQAATHSQAPQSIEAAMRVSSYADLLKPIPNALALLRASEAAPLDPALVDPAVARLGEGEAAVQDAQFYYHHHHHHHHRYYRRRYYHHHHHHHHRYYRY